MTQQQADAPINRQTKRRERTRAQLIDAAKVLFARQGTERTRINEITEQADVGFGSFYNHFAGKDELVEAVVREIAEDHGRALVAATAGTDDPAEVISIAHRYFVRVALEHPDWAWLAIRLDDSNRTLFDTLRPFAERDLERAVDAGRLEIDDPGVALAAAGGALQGVIRAVLGGQLGEGADSEHAELVLRMFGLPAAEAAKVARRPFPEIALTPIP